MGWTVELYDPRTTTTYNITNKTNQIDILNNLDDNSSSCSISAFNIEQESRFFLVSIKKDNVLKWSGIVINQNESNVFSAKEEYGIKQTQFECFSYEYLLNVRVVSDTYENESLDEIVKDIVNKSLPELTTNNVISSIVNLDFIQFQYNKVKDAFRQIFEHAYEWHWYIDENKDVHMFYQFEGTGLFTTASNIIMESLKVSYKGEQQANRIWIIGAKQASPNFIEQFYIGDGAQRYFQLAYEPNYTEIYINDVLVNSKLEQNNDEEQDFLINKKNRVFFIPENIETPFTGTIKARYRPTIQLIDYYENPSDIQNYFLLERVVKNKDITDRLSARQFGKAEIRRKSITKRLISFNSRNEYKIGQKCVVNITKGKWNIAGEFLVKSVGVNITPSDFIYSVEMEELI